jgi:hypothetical protein
MIIVPLFKLKCNTETEVYTIISLVASICPLCSGEVHYRDSKPRDVKNLQGKVRHFSRQRVIITVLDEPISESNEKPQAKAWREFFEVVNASNEKIPEKFEKVSFTREGNL